MTKAENFTIKIDRELDNFAIEKIAKAISLSIVDAVLQSGMQCPGCFGRRASKKNSRIDVWQKDCINIYNISNKPTQRQINKFYSIYYMIGGQDNEYETINNGLNDDIEKYKDVISDNALTLKCDGDDAAPNVTIECKSILSTFEYDLTQLECRVEYLNNETPSTFYSGYNYSYNHVKEWAQFIMDTINSFENSNCTVVAEIYNRCKKKSDVIISGCDTHLQKLKAICDDDKMLLHCFNGSQEKLAAKGISYIIPDKEKLQQMINCNKLYQTWIGYINEGHSKPEADLLVARTFYKDCTYSELQNYLIIKDSDELKDMPMIARKLFGNDNEGYDEWKEKLNAISQVVKKDDFNKHIYTYYDELRTELYKKGVKFIREDIYLFIVENYTGNTFDLPAKNSIFQKGSGKNTRSRSSKSLATPTLHFLSQQV